MEPQNGNIKPKILIVDDQTENIKILGLLLQDDYIPMAATSGEKALEHALSEHKPDLILLDIMMPGMDGYEVCRRLKADERTLDIPVIFITSMTKMENESRGFEFGAVDYITKPFSPAIVAARVRTHVNLKQHRDYLEWLAGERARQLVHAERLATLGTLSAGIAHEIGNSLLVISANAELLQREFKEYFQDPSHDAHKGTGSAMDTRFLFETYPKRFLKLLGGVERISSIVGSMRTFSRRDGDKTAKVKIEACIENALNLCGHALKRYKVLFRKPQPQLPPVPGDGQQLEQVFVNLFKNAADAMAPCGGGALDITAERIASGIRVVVEDNGPGIADDRIEAVWEPFYTTKSVEEGTGLGLSISRGIIEDHKGAIRVENRAGDGTRFVIELPVERCNTVPERCKE